MPTYDYECQACKHAFSAFQSMKDEPFKDCPKCKKPALKRLIGAGAGIIFKGSGFYCTDYKSSHCESSSKSSSSESGSSSKEKPESSGKDKPAEKKSEKKSDKNKGGAAA